MNLALRLSDGMLSKYPKDEFMRPGDIVINSTGTGTLGRVGIFRDNDAPMDVAVVPDSHVTIIRSCECISSEYLYLCLKGMQIQLEQMGEGSTNQKELKSAALRNLLIPVPPLAEQYGIVDMIVRARTLFTEIEEGLN